MGLDSVDLLYNAEKELGAELVDSVAEQIVTVRDFASAFLHAGVDDSEENILKRITQVISESQGIPLDAIKPEHKLSADLGID